MSYLRNMNVYDKALLLLFVSLFSGNLGGVLLLPRTFSILLIPLLSNKGFGLWNVSAKKPRLLLFLWILWGGVSLLWTPDISRGLEDFVLLIFNALFAYEILTFSSRSKNPLVFIALGWLISLSINNCIGLWEIYTDHHLAVSKFGSDREIKVEGYYVLMRYANGFFSNYNAFVTFICCALPFLYYLFFTVKSRALKIFVICNLIASVYILFMDASRGGIIVLAIVSALFFLGTSRVKGSTKISVVLFSIIICYIIWSWDSISSLVVGRQNNINGIEDEARYIVWINCLKVLIDTGGLGTGIGGVGSSMEVYAGYGGTLAPHNAFLEILIQYGVIVFIVFVYFLFILYFNAKKNKQGFSRIVIYSSLLAIPFTFLINSVYLNNPFFWASLMSLYIYSDLKLISVINKR